MIFYSILVYKVAGLKSAQTVTTSFDRARNILDSHQHPPTTRARDQAAALQSSSSVTNPTGKRSPCRGTEQGCGGCGCNAPPAEPAEQPAPTSPATSSLLGREQAAPGAEPIAHLGCAGRGEGSRPARAADPRRKPAKWHSALIYQHP